MQIHELIERLQKYPGHYEVEIFKDGMEAEDLAADIVDVFNAPATKIVSLEIDILLPE